MDMSLSKFREMVKDIEEWCASVHGLHVYECYKETITLSQKCTEENLCI